jgi:membrane-associated phospholipid phosphatase
MHILCLVQFKYYVRNNLLLFSMFFVCQWNYPVIAEILRCFYKTPRPYLSAGSIMISISNIFNFLIIRLFYVLCILTVLLRYVHGLHRGNGTKIGIHSRNRYFILIFSEVPRFHKKLDIILPKIENLRKNAQNSGSYNIRKLIDSSFF